MNGGGARQLTLCGTLIFQVVFPSLGLIRLKVLCTSGEELQAWARAGAIVHRTLFLMLKFCQDIPLFSAGVLRLLKLCLGQTSCKLVGSGNVLGVTQWLKFVYKAAGLPLFDLTANTVFFQIFEPKDIIVSFVLRPLRLIFLL